MRRSPRRAAGQGSSASAAARRAARWRHVAAGRPSPVVARELLACIGYSLDTRQKTGARRQLPVVLVQHSKSIVMLTEGKHLDAYLCDSVEMFRCAQHDNVPIA